MLTELSVVLGVIDEGTFQERMDYLAELLGEPDASSGGGSSSGNGDEPPQEASREESPSRAEAHQDIVGQNGGGGGDEPPDWLQFIPGGAINHLKRWRFIKGDPDPHPSVPHGHDEGRSFPKLDPYLGWIHASTQKTSGRLSHDDTRSLWNDGGFRDFASAALVHFAQENPHYVWRVPYPMRLPHRR